MIVGTPVRYLLAMLAVATLCPTGKADPRNMGATETLPAIEVEAIDRAVDDVVRRHALPGIAVGVVVDGHVVYRGTRGELAAGSGEAINEDSLFKVASLTKAMTTAVLARLVDAGKLRWDDPVTRHLPDFRMHDPWVTRHIQVRDLLIHNSGLGAGAGDLMLWPEPNAYTRADIIAGLAHLKPTHGFRARYAYDNLLYVVAGEVAAVAAGKPYALLVREEVFQPLGMQRCQVGAWSREAVGNIAQPHMRQKDRNVVVRADGQQEPDLPSTAAGGVRCSLDDMLTWVRTWLQEPDPARPWLSETQRRELWTLHTPMPISRRMRERDGTRMHGYGYGWRVSDVDGEWKVAHTGTLMGMYSSLVLLPDRDIGFIIMINGPGDQARTVLEQALLKRFTRPDDGGLDVTHHAAVLEHYAKAGPAGASLQAPDTSMRKAAASTALPARQGVWRDPWFGEVELCPRAGGLRFRARKSPSLDGRVMQVGDRWLVDWDDASVDAEPWLAFVAADGRARMRLSNVDPAADFSYDYQDLDFTRIGPCTDTP